MNYQLYQLKIEQLVSYFQQSAINLSPAFQRGRVWNLTLRKRLLENILQGKPIPAVFLYKKPSKERNIFMILDGKQRLESILLYIGSIRPQFKVDNWKDYFSRQEDRAKANFKVAINDIEKNVGELSNEETRQFRDYQLSVIEIDLTESASLEEIIQLFVDINSYGEQVNRFDIVKALYLKDPLLQQVFGLIAMKWQKGANDPLYKIKKSSVYRRVMRRLSAVLRAHSIVRQIDIMWERLFEFALFVHSGDHKKTSEILREFIGRDKTDQGAQKLTTKQLTVLMQAFKFVAAGYKSTPALQMMRWATDQTHFYTMITAFIKRLRDSRSLDAAWYGKLIAFDKAITKVEQEQKSGTQMKREGLASIAERYIKLSAKQTTDVGKRGQREDCFWEAINTAC
jgi:hypothetical protein